MILQIRKKMFIASAAPKTIVSGTMFLRKPDANEKRNAAENIRFFMKYVKRNMSRHSLKRKTRTTWTRPKKVEYHHQHVLETEMIGMIGRQMESTFC